MKIAFLGSGEFGIPCLDALVASDHDLRLVVSQPPKSSGRGKKLTPTPVGQWARDHDIALLETDEVNGPVSLQRIGREHPELLVVIAFGQKIGQDLIGLPPHEAINVHASYLPRWRGAAPINWAIVNGDSTTGVTIIALAEKMDAGDILGALETPIEAGETAGDLHDRLARLSAPLLLDTINRIEHGSVQRVAQDHSQATLAKKLKKSDGFIDFKQPAELIERQIRGFWPWPGACADYVQAATGKAARVTLAEVQELDPQQTTLNPGQLNDELDVVCGEGALRIRKLKPAGSALMEWRDFVNGRHCQPGDQLKTIE